MKKHNEGYALPFVLVVLIVMCLIVVGIMDFSLRNLKSQQNTILRMEAKYEAAGQIEQIIATLENKKTDSFQKSDTLLFLVSGGKLKVAASGGADGSVWIIAELAPKKQGVFVTSAFEENGRTYVPVRAVSEGLGKKVTFIPDDLVIIGDKAYDATQELYNNVVSLY